MSNIDDGIAKTRTVGILVFDEVEVLDVAGPFEVFSVTRLDEVNRDFTESPFRILLLSNDTKPIKAIGGLKLQPDYTFENCPPLDLFIVPGGWGTRTEVNNCELIQKILNLSEKSSERYNIFSLRSPPLQLQYVLVQVYWEKQACWTVNWQLLTGEHMTFLASPHQKQRLKKMSYSQ